MTANESSSRTDGIDPAQAMPFIRGLLRTYSEMTAQQLAVELYGAFDVDRTDQAALVSVQVLLYMAEQHGIATRDTDGIFEIDCRGIEDYSDAHLLPIAARAHTNGSPIGSDEHITRTARHLGFSRTTKQLKQRIAAVLVSQTSAPGEKA